MTRLDPIRPAVVERFVNQIPCQEFQTTFNKSPSVYASGKSKKVDQTSGLSY